MHLKEVVGEMQHVRAPPGAAWGRTGRYRPWVVNSSRSNSGLATGLCTGCVLWLGNALCGYCMRCVVERGAAPEQSSN